MKDIDMNHTNTHTNRWQSRVRGWWGAHLGRQPREDLLAEELGSKDKEEWREAQALRS